MKTPTSGRLSTATWSLNAVTNQLRENHANVLTLFGARLGPNGQAMEPVSLRHVKKAILRPKVNRVEQEPARKEKPALIGRLDQLLNAQLEATWLKRHVSVEFHVCSLKRVNGRSAMRISKLLTILRANVKLSENVVSSEKLISQS